MDDEAAFERECRAWRKAQDEALRRDDGWLCVVGLVWLTEGVNRLEGVEAGVLTRRGARVSWTPTGGASRTLRPDNPADRVTVGSTTFQLLQRGERLGVRLWDTRSPARRRFTGRRWFPPRASWRVRAAFVAYPPGKTIPVTNVLGDTQTVACPGYVAFTIDGRACRLDAQAVEGGGLFLNFRDATSGKETYPPGRFLEAAAPAEGFVVLDFNRAVSPPCAFTDHATCPLPPPGNALAVAVTAGERWQSHGGR